MKVQLKLDSGMKLIGTNADNLQTFFDASIKGGGEGSAATPMEILLESMAACSMIDVISILRKKRKTLIDFKIEIDGERATTHPMVFTKVHLKFILTSPDAQLNDLEHAVELSQTTYCGASAMFQKSGCEVSWSTEIIN